MRIKWTPELCNRIEALAAEGMPVKDMKNVLGICSERIVKYLDENGIPRIRKASPVRVTPEILSRAVARYQAGESLPAIARAEGVAHPALWRRLKQSGIPMRSLAESKRKYTCNHHFFDVIDTEEKAYWLGFIMADGCVSGNALIVSLAEKDTEHLHRMASALEATHPVKDKIKSSGYGDFLNCRLHLTSSELVAGLADKGVHPRKSNTCEWPKGVPADLEHHFVRGYVDGDGSFFTTRDSLGFSAIGSISFIASLQTTLMRECGLGLTRLYQKPNSPVTSVRYGGNRQVSRIGAYLYKDATIYLERKRSVVRSLEHLARVPSYAFKCLSRRYVPDAA
jgi:hypothetical protein